jgi:sugar O-acyltransferase (sialic acid O-acetyltransferase NeuD family)
MLQRLNYTIDCCITKFQEPGTSRNIFSVPIISGDEKLHEKYQQGYRKVFIAIGDNLIRKKLVQFIGTIGFEFINIVSDQALVSKKAVLGSGVLIMPGATINADAKIGSYSIINTGAVVEHECLIKEYSHIGSNAVLCGRVEIGIGAFIGAGSSVLPSVKIGARVKVGSGSVVTRDVLNDEVVYGNPARIKPKVP